MGHSNDIVFHNIQNSLKLSHTNTLILMDRVDQEHIALIWDLFRGYYKLIEYQLFVKTNCHHLCIVP